MLKHKLIRKPFFVLISLFTLIMGCATNKEGIYESYQKSGKIEYYNSTEIRQRHVDSLNALRQERGLNEVTISHFLNSSAATHARDIYLQQRAWNFGSDGSSPQERAEVAGFSGVVIGENVSETFEGEFLLLQVWLENSLSQSVLLDRDTSHIGLGWFQEESGKIWWVQVLGKKPGFS
mgnify:CR=1 FL=1